MRTQHREAANSLTQGRALSLNLLPFSSLLPFPFGKPSASRGKSSLSPKEKMVIKDTAPELFCRQPSVLENAALDSTFQRHSTHKPI